MKLHHLRPAKGAKKARTRVGRGRAGARGKTAGRGMKGTGARGTIRAGFEGGQMPLNRRIPKLKGFKNPNRVEFAPVNVEILAKYFDGTSRRRRSTSTASRTRGRRSRSSPAGSSTRS